MRRYAADQLQLGHVPSDVETTLRGLLLAPPVRRGFNWATSCQTWKRADGMRGCSCQRWLQLGHVPSDVETPPASTFFAADSSALQLGHVLSDVETVVMRTLTDRSH